VACQVQRAACQVQRAACQELEEACLVEVVALLEEIDFQTRQDLVQVSLARGKEEELYLVRVERFRNATNCFLGSFL